MPSKYNRVYLSAAGSRKTSLIIDEALKNRDKRTLITTYTIENLGVITNYLQKKNGIIPNNINVMSWYTFMLRELARPYQNYLYEKRIDGIEFVPGYSAKYVPENNVEKHYFVNKNRIFPDKISKFACRCDELSAGLIIGRLEKIYDRVFIDEAQDLSGYDLDILEKIFSSNIEVLAVADSRQATYFTNCSPKNKKYKGYYLNRLLYEWQKIGLCQVKEKNTCYRSNQEICSFADLLYPEMKRTVSENKTITGHDGIHLIKSKDVVAYVNKYNPIVLRDTRQTKTGGFIAINFGLSKGKTFDRVLIFPNNPIKEFLITGKPEVLKPTSKARFYVGITRARFSVGIVFDLNAFDKKIKVFSAA